MAKLKRLSGEDVLNIFFRFGFRIHSQRGSHIKPRRHLEDGAVQTLTVPRHDEIDRGTLRSIYRNALRYLSDADLRVHFYTS
jgi:predicted RNA binding protein YcfA (HicA-like mRNA interferase family)